MSNVRMSTSVDMSQHCTLPRTQGKRLWLWAGRGGRTNLQNGTHNVGGLKLSLLQLLLIHLLQQHEQQHQKISKDPGVSLFLANCSREQLDLVKNEESSCCIRDVGNHTLGKIKCAISVGLIRLSQTSTTFHG